jgi:phosphatidate cytidylyltransferase
MFRTKVLTAVVAIPLLLVLLYLGSWWLFLPATALMLIGLQEFYRAMRLKGIHPVDPAGWICAFGIMASTQFLADAPEWRSGVITACVAGAVLVGMIAQFWRPEGSSVIANSGATVFGVVYVALLFSFFLRLRWVPLHEVGGLPVGGFRDRTGALLLVMLAVWCQDGAAQIVGRLCGTWKPFPKISPNKTIEGCVGGLLAAVVATLAFGAALHLNLAHLLGLGLVLGVLGQFGDLCKSMIKRELGIKDFGDLIPGHGGVLDRFDSLLFTMPVAYLYFRLFVMPV